MTGFDMTGLEQILGQMPLGMLLVRMGLVAAFVVTIALVAERLGPFLGAMVASLPLYTGPIYLLLALEHEAAYFTMVSVTSAAVCGAIPVFVLGYAMLAWSRGTALSLAGALTAWFSVAAFVQSREWSLPEAMLFVAPIYATALVLARSFTRGVAVRTAPRRWTDLAQRAVLVALSTGVIIVASQHVPPAVTGILSVMPVLTASLILVMQPRVGGRATAALLANTLGGLVGMVLAFGLVHLTVEPLGKWTGLGLGLALTVGWNVMLIVARSIRMRAARMPPPARRTMPPPLPAPRMPERNR